jgi:hypothetical protein
MTQPPPDYPHGLIRGMRLWQATALNITIIVGAGGFATIPTMIGLLPGQN